MPTKRYLLLLCLLLITQISCTQARNRDSKTLSGRAVKIIDGDTFDLLTADNNIYRIRLHGIDCPERGMDYYKVAKTALGDLCLDHQLKVIIRNKDRYKRSVGDVYTEDENTWINQQMVAGGYAWHYTRYDNDARLVTAMIAARKARLGLWAIPNPTPPWEWRKERRQRKAY